MLVHDGLVLEGPDESIPDFFGYRTASASAGAQQDWFAQPNALDDFGLFQCRVRGEYEDKVTAQQDWTLALIGKRSQTTMHNSLAPQNIKGN